MIPGTMMDDYPLTLTALFERAGKFFARNDIVTRRPDGSLHRYAYGEYCRRGRHPAHPESAPAPDRSGLHRRPRGRRHLDCR